MSLVTLVWAGNFSAGKFGATELHPYFIAGTRIFLAAVFFVAFLPAGERRGLLSARNLRLCLPLAVTGIATNQICFASGIRLTLPSHSAIIHCLIPVFVFVLGWLFLRERSGPLAWLGMLVAIGGALFVALSAPAEERRTTLVGDLITLAGALAFSAYVVIGRRIIPEVGAWKAVATGFLIAAPLTAPFFAWGVWQQDWTIVTHRGWAGLGYMIVGATFFCYSAHMWSLKHLDALQVSVFILLQPMLGTTIAALFGQERITMSLVVSGAVAILGVALVQFAPKPSRRPAPVEAAPAFARE